GGRIAGIGAAVRVTASGDTVSLRPTWGPQWIEEQADSLETFTITVSDFDRDTAGHDDALLLGSRGAALLFKAQPGIAQGTAYPGWPQRLPRSTLFTDTLGTYVGED